MWYRNCRKGGAGIARPSSIGLRKASVVNRVSFLSSCVVSAPSHFPRIGWFGNLFHSGPERTLSHERARQSCTHSQENPNG